MKDKLVIASDHGGFELKEKIFNYLKEDGWDITNFGTNSAESCDYPTFAKEVAKAVANNDFNKGILICGTGLGMQITANKTKGIRAVCVSDTYSAKMSREHNDSNILCFGQRVIGFGLAQDIVNIWLNTEFLGDRHKRRVDMIED